jgi:F-type H+-transporting ATPase subunit b
MEALGISLPGVLAQVVNFLLLFFLLSRFAFPAIRNMLDQRATRIEEALAAAERARAEAAQSQAEIQAQIDEARRQGQVIIEQASRAAEQLRAELSQQAEVEALRIKERAQADFELEREKAMTELRRQFADLTVTAAEKVISRSLDRQAHERLILDVLDESRR